MATIVNGSRRRRITAPPPRNLRTAQLVFHATTQQSGKTVTLSGVRSIRSVVPDLAVLTAHFGLSESACVRLAVRLLANAVRVGRFALAEGAE
jgi:hypothetical protein